MEMVKEKTERKRNLRKVSCVINSKGKISLSNKRARDIMMRQDKQTQVCLKACQRIVLR